MRARGVIAMSAGNHAQGVAYHAQRLGLRAVIVMPRFTPGVKVERTRGFGAEVVLHGDTLDEARAHAFALAAAQKGWCLCTPTTTRPSSRARARWGWRCWRPSPTWTCW
jgi:threonine dehydratase